MDTVITLNTELPAPVSGQAAPDWVQFAPAGRVTGNDGRGPWTVDPARIAAASRVPMPIDENHAIDLQGPAGGAAPARGWIVELQGRADGLWGRVEWTPEGSALIAGRSYRSVSPALAIDKKTGVVTRIVRAALTNMPNFDLLSLNHQQDARMDLDKLRAALGLKADATLEECVAAAERQSQAITLHSQQMTRLAAAAGAPANADVAAIETVLAAARPAQTEVTRLAAEIVSLNTQLAQVTNGQKRDKAETAIDVAIKAGKPITALRDHYISRHMADPAGVELELNAMLSLHSGGVPPGRDPANPAALTDAEAEVAARMGLTPDQIKAAREARQASGGRR